MKEFPVFVPDGADHFGAVITVPDSEPKGLVLLLTGTGAARSHRFQLWTRVARALSEQGLAVARLDYEGVGDSTGGIREIGLTLTQREAMAVLAFARRAIPVDQVAVVGNCSGAIAALGVAAQTPDCIGSVCILTRLLMPSTVNRIVISRRGSRLASFVRSNPLLHRVSQPFRGRRGKPSENVTISFHRALGHSRLFFLYGEEDTDAYNPKVKDSLNRLLGHHSAEERARFELQVLPGGSLSGFESLETQRLTIDTVVGWLTSCFGITPDGTREPSRAAQT